MYNIIEINTGNIVQSDLTYEQCIDWLDNFGNIIDYTIVLI